MTERGPIYGVDLIESLPILGSSMYQAMPSRIDLEQVRKISERTAAGYEVLLAHYRNKCAEVDRLKAELEVEKAKLCPHDTAKEFADSIYKDET